MTAKLDIQKLAATLTGKERAKLMISSWHDGIMGKSERFTKSELNSLLYFDNQQEASTYSYFMNLYKHGYFYFGNAMQQVYLHIVGLGTQLHQFHVAFGIDGAIDMALRAIENVPTFIPENEFRQKREQELANSVEPITYLANYETNTALQAQGFFDDKNEFDYYLDTFETTATIEDVKRELGDLWFETYWEQVTRIRALVKDGVLQSTNVPEGLKKLRGLQITQVHDGVSTKSWEQFEGKLYKDYRPYLEMDELYALSYDPDEIKEEAKGTAFKVKMRDYAVEICNKLKVLDYEFSDGVKKIKINESSLIVSDPQKTLRGLEEQIQTFFTYSHAAEMLARELDDVPLFDQNSRTLQQEQCEYLDKLIIEHNEFIHKLEKSHFKFIRVELVDKAKYLLTKKDVIPEKANELVQEIKELAEKEVGVRYH